MSQPVAVFGKIPVSERSFKAFLKTGNADRLVAFIFSELDDPGRNFYVFRYLKKEAAVFAFFYFNYGNRDLLLQSVPLTVLLALAPFAAPQATGHVLATLDALNLGKEDNIAAYRIQEGQVTEISAITDEEWNLLLKDVKKYFFNKATADFASEFHRGQLVDTAIVKKCTALAEEKRKTQVLQNLHTASFTSPLHFFDNYYYNGQFIYYSFGIIAVLDKINPLAFKQTAYGGTDGNYVAIGGTLIKADAATFKKLQKYENVYYTSATGVYDAQLQPVPEADPASFRLADEYHATDKAHIYFNGLVIDKTEVGRYTLYTKGYFWANIVLMGEKTVYVGKEKITVDAASFTIVHYPAGIHHNNYFVLVAKDREGTMILYKKYPYKDPVQLLRDEDPDAFIASVKATLNQATAHVEKIPPPPRGGDNGEAYYHSFSNWAQQYFDTYFEEHRYDYDLYRLINNYFATCFELKKYTEAILLYEKIKDTAWLNPHLFHHTACLYMALHEQEKAIAELRKALVYGYSEIDRIWTDKDLEPIWTNEKFVQLRNFHQANPHPVASLELLEAIVQLQANKGVERFAKTIIRELPNRVYFPDPATIPEHTGDATLDAHYKKYRELLATVFVTCFNNGLITEYDALYRVYCKHAAITPQVHYLVLQNLFRHAHFSGHANQEELEKCLLVVALLKEAVNRITDEEQKAAATAAFNDDGFFQFVLGL